MEKKDIKYKRLPGVGRIIFGKNPGSYILCLAEDHILQARMTLFSESYKKFYFKDIQAVVFSRTNKRAISSIIPGILTIISGLIFYSSIYTWGSDISTIIPLGILFAIPASLFVSNIFLGPTCTCRLYTAVQAEDILSLGRIRNASKVMAVLNPLIDASQGELKTEDFVTEPSEHIRVTASAHATPTSFFPSIETNQGPQSLKHEHGKAHAILFFILLYLAISAYMDIFFQHSFKNLIDGISFAAAIIISIMALMRQANSDLQPEIKRLTWISTVVLILNFLFSQVYGTIYRVMHFDNLENPYYFDMKYEGPIFVTYCVVAAIAFSILGVMGIIRVHRFRTAYSAFMASSTNEASRQEGAPDGG